MSNGDHSGNGRGVYRIVLGILLAMAGTLIVWDRATIKDELRELRKEDVELRKLIRDHVSGDLRHRDLDGSLRAIEREVFERKAGNR